MRGNSTFSYEKQTAHEMTSCLFSPFFFLLRTLTHINTHSLQSHCFQSCTNPCFMIVITVVSPRSNNAAESLFIYLPTIIFFLISCTTYLHSHCIVRSGGFFSHLFFFFCFFLPVPFDDPCLLRFCLFFFSTIEHLLLLFFCVFFFCTSVNYKKRRERGGGGKKKKKREF